MRRIAIPTEVDCHECGAEWETDRHREQVVAVVLLTPGESYNPTEIHQAVAEDLGIHRRELHSVVMGCTDKAELLKDREVKSVTS